MKKIKLNKLVLNKIFKGLVDTMIPMSQDKIMPKASEAINLKLFLKNIFRIKAIICGIHKEDKIILFFLPLVSLNSNLKIFKDFISFVMTLSVE